MFIYLFYTATLQMNLSIHNMMYFYLKLEGKLHEQFEACSRIMGDSYEETCT